MDLSVQVLVANTDGISYRPVAFFDELAANATKHDVKVVIYLGNDDSVCPHFSSESTLLLFIG